MLKTSLHGPQVPKHIYKATNTTRGSPHLLISLDHKGKHMCKAPFVTYDQRQVIQQTFL